MEILRQWFQRFSADPQAVILVLVLLVGFVVVLTMGKMLGPVLAALVLAYLLEGLVSALQEYGIPRFAAVILVFIIFMVFLMFSLLGLFPRLSYQLTQLVHQLPSIIGKGHDALMRLPERYPELISEAQINDVINVIRAELAGLGQRVVSMSVASVVGVITLMVYVILVPVLVFFFLKDKTRIIQWMTIYLPRDRALTKRVWSDVNAQIANYVRGKIWEILIVGSVSYVTFVMMEFTVLGVAGNAGRLVGGDPLHRCGRGDPADRCDRIFSVGLECGLLVRADRLRRDPGARRQCAGATAVLRGCESAPGRNHNCGTGIWRPVGFLGCVLRDSAGHPGAGGAQGLAAWKRTALAQETVPN